MASRGRTPGDSRRNGGEGNRGQRNSWWDGQCTALAVILAVLLLVLFGILYRQARLPWQQGEKPGMETLESQSPEGTEKPGESGAGTAETEETGIPESGEAAPESTGESAGPGESAESGESTESGAESSSESSGASSEASSEESSGETAESTGESTEASTEESTEETKPARKVSDYGPGARVDSEAIQELGSSAFFTQSEISGSVKDRIVGKSYRENPHISLSDLRYIRVLYYDYDGNRRVGELVSNKAISSDLVDIFEELYEAEYPIDKMRLVDDYDASDDWSSSENNTSCFNYRTVAGSNSLSLHARGLAIDINPRDNPMVYYDENGDIEQCLPANGEAYADRSKNFSHKIDKSDLCYQLFMEHGFTWGGNWNAPDYMHFSKSSTPEGG